MGFVRGRQRTHYTFVLFLLGILVSFLIHCNDILSKLFIGLLHSQHILFQFFHPSFSHDRILFQPKYIGLCCLMFLFPFMTFCFEFNKFHLFHCIIFVFLISFGLLSCYFLFKQCNGFHCSRQARCTFLSCFFFCL